MRPGETPESEATAWTAEAFERGRAAALAHDHAATFEERDGQLLMFLYLHGTTALAVNVAGQPPDPRGHRQGLSGARLNRLYEIEEKGVFPVLLAFFHRSWKVAWLADLPRMAPGRECISHGQPPDAFGTSRWGWYAGDDRGVLADRGAAAPFFAKRGLLALGALPERRGEPSRQGSLLGG